MTTQTKRLSAATVLSTLGDNDKIVVTTEAGTTGLVSSANLRNFVSPVIQNLNSGDAGKWVRIASADTADTCGIIYLNAFRWSSNQRGHIFAISNAFIPENADVKEILGGAIKKVRIVKSTSSDYSQFYFDIFVPAEQTTYEPLRVTCSGLIKACQQVIEPSIDEVSYVKEFNVGGGRNLLIYNPLKAKAAERRAT